MMLTPLGGAHLKAAISRRDAEHNSPAFDAAGRRLGSFDYATCHLSCLVGFTSPADRVACHRWLSLFIGPAKVRPPQLCHLFQLQ